MGGVGAGGGGGEGRRAMLAVRVVVLVGDVLNFLYLYFHSFLNQLRTREFTQTGFCVGICTSTVNTRIRSFPQVKQEFIQIQNKDTLQAP